MEVEKAKRPHISSYSDPVEFIRDMLAYLRLEDSTFSTLYACKELRKVSPTLISLILSRKRKITFDRCEEIAKLLRLSSAEKFIFKSWIERNQKSSTAIEKPSLNKNRKEISTHILTDWLNVYVKDCFQIKSVQKNPKLIFDYLAPLASPKRIQKSMDFLLREGHLRKNLEGEVVVETNLTTMDPKVPNQKVRQFHKSALGVAQNALELFPTDERFANTFLLALDEARYAELKGLIEDFSEKVKSFAAENDSPGERLYQIIVNLSPTGGKLK